MFSTIIYFLVALIIYATSELFGVNDPGTSAGWLQSLVLGIGFFLICRLSFRRILNAAKKSVTFQEDRAISSTISRLSVLALLVFAVNIYVFRLNTAFSHVRLFQKIPTLEALLFLGLFVSYLVMVWYAAYPVQKHLFSRPVSCKQYLFSQLTFALPTLLPWLCLSLFMDLIRFIAYPPLDDLMTGPAGEMIIIMVFIAGIAVFGPVFIKTIWQCRPMEKGPVRSRIEAMS